MLERTALAICQGIERVLIRPCQPNCGAVHTLGDSVGPPWEPGGKHWKFAMPRAIALRSDLESLDDSLEIARQAESRVKSGSFQIRAFAHALGLHDEFG